ncbi:MAG: hypothetical protein C5B52_17400 [Bacteroidetes bacterium]|nr:MAG: hypothetical protein C5B52_17400 [Bacteroidota bacterium]
MSYCSRVYRHRNANTPEDSEPAPFFSRQTDQRKANAAGGFFQTKLSVNKPGDSFENEADAVAHSVVNNTSNKPVIQQKKMTGVQRLATPTEDDQLGTNDARMKKDKDIQTKPMGGDMDEKDKLKGIQKKDNPKEDEDKMKKPGTVQRKSEPSTSEGFASPGLSAQVEKSAGSGKKMSGKTLSEMNSSFGVDFSNVRIHMDNEAVSMNQELKAQAFTFGKDIYFNSGKFNPESSQGKFLLAHELTHVLQQNSDIQKKSIQRTIGDTHDLVSPRFKGDTDLEACFDGEKIIRKPIEGEFVKKIQQALVDAGFPLPKFGVDGKFGDETKAAVKEFQKQSGLEAAQQDGEVGPITMSRLDSRFSGSSAKTVEKTCENGIKTVTIDFVKMKGSNGNSATDLAFANNVFKDCCIQFAAGTEVTMPDTLSDSVLGGDTDLNVAPCNAVSSEDLITFLTATSLFGLTNKIIVFYVETLHQGTERLGGDSTSQLCATGPRAPMQGMVEVANGAPSRTFPHELAHILMSTFEDHKVTEDNLQHTSGGAKGEKIAPVQCAIMYTRAG